MSYTKLALEAAYDFLLKEYPADPDTGETVTKEVRTLFNLVCFAMQEQEGFKYRPLGELTQTRTKDTLTDGK